MPDQPEPSQPGSRRHRTAHMWGMTRDFDFAPTISNSTRLKVIL